PFAEVVCRLSNPRRTTQRFGGAGKAPAAGAGFPGTPPPSELPAGCGAVCWLRSFWVRISLQVRFGLNFDALLRLGPTDRPPPPRWPVVCCAVVALRVLAAGCRGSRRRTRTPSVTQPDRGPP